MKVNLNEYVSLKTIPSFLQKGVNSLLQKTEGSTTFAQWSYPLDLPENFEDQFEEYVRNLIGENNIQIHGGWINSIKHQGVDNGMDWHNENGVGRNNNTILKGDFACIFWIQGEVNKGGNLKFINERNEIIVVPFDPPGFIILKKDTLHSVENYFSNKNRVSLNFDLQIN